MISSIKDLKENDAHRAKRQINSIVLFHDFKRSCKLF